MKHLITRCVLDALKFFKTWPALRWLPRLTMTLVLASALGACGVFGASQPVQTEQTNITLLVEASTGLNPDVQGRAAPVLMRVYELRGHNAFQEADFFALYNADRSTLGTDVLAVDQVILRPGQSYSIRRKSNPETRAIGVLVGYRDLPMATWRAVYPMPAAPEAKWYRSLLPNKSVELQIDLLPSAVRITDLLLGRAPLPPTDPRANSETSTAAGNTLRIAPAPPSSQGPTMPVLPSLPAMPELIHEVAPVPNTL